MGKEREIEELKSYISSKNLNVQQRIDEVIKRNLIGGDKSTDVLDILLNGLSSEEGNRLIGQLVLTHWNNVKDDPEVFLRNATLYKTAMMHHFKGKMDDKAIEKYLNNPYGYMQNMRIPAYLKNVLSIIVDDQIAVGRPLTQLAHNIVFAMVLGPVGDYQNKKIVNIQNQRYEAQAHVKQTKGENRKVAQKQVELLEAQEKDLKELNNEVMKANRIFTDVNRMLSQKAPDRTSEASERILAVADQVHRKGSGINSQHIESYIKIQENILSSVSGKYEKGSISTQTEGIRQVFDSFTDKPKRDAVMMDQQQLQAQIKMMQSTRMPIGWERKQSTLDIENKASEAQKEKPILGIKNKTSGTENKSPTLERKIQEFKDANKEVKGLESKMDSVQQKKQDLADRKKEAILKRLGKETGLEEAATPKMQRRDKVTDLDEAATPKISRRKISPRSH
jgi:hypothetical protein